MHGSLNTLYTLRSHAYEPHVAGHGFGHGMLRSQTSEAKRSDTFYFLGAKRTPPEGWFHEPRSEAESALRKKKSRTRRVHSHARAMHAQCTRSTITYAPSGCMKFTHTAGVHAHTCTRSVTTEAKRGHEKHAMHPKRNDRSEARSRHAKITARSHLHVHVIVSKLRTHARAAHTCTRI